ncbi:MAG: conjugal transfer protein TraR [Zetaproteobacteria bacterium]|nr:conjugal transfer protein TraR [Pseudobdellovibrionaceae bacterium]
MDTFLNELGFPGLLILLCGSLWLLMKGADWLIDGSTNLARRIGVSELVIGLTVVAFGTSLPELVVSVQAALIGKGSLSFANVIGSNIANIGLVLGFTAIIHPLTASAPVRQKDTPFAVLIVFAFLATLLSQQTNAGDEWIFPRWGGGLLLFLFGIFILRLIFFGKEEDQDDEPHDLTMTVAILLIIGGSALLGLGGFYTVEAASRIAMNLGISEHVVGLTVVAFGTSLPELVACIVGARKKMVKLVLGNILGSNLMNLTLVLGSASAIREISIDKSGVIDSIAMVAITCSMAFFLMRKKVPHLSRRVGFGWVGFWIMYMAYTGVRSLG